MILCEREIQEMLRRKLITITDHPDANSKRWSSTALDLTLHNILLKWNPLKPKPTGAKADVVVPFSENFNIQSMMEDSDYATRVTIPTEGYALEPHGFVLGFTVEKVSIPHECRIAARVEGKSSLARLGLGVHVTAPTIHAGFGPNKDRAVAPIQLEIFNLGPFTISLNAGMSICQLIFEEVREVPTAGYSGQFAGQQAFTAPGPEKPTKRKSNGRGK